MTALTNKTPILSMALIALPFLLGTHQCEPDPPVCTEEWAPVCGEDGVTYSNACHAEAAGVRVAHEGECGPALCMDDSECAQGERCSHDECLSPCRDGEICPAVCYGACEPDPGGRLCYADDQCGELEYCHTDDICRAPPSEGPGADLTVCYGECRPRRQCDDLVCPAIYCPYGYVTDPHGCATCECAPEPPSCEPVACDLYCEHGFAPDDRGCPTCACNEPPPPPVCDEVLCDLYCEHGFTTDDRGCAICECAPPPPPMLCLSDEGCRPHQRCDFDGECRSLCADPADVCPAVCAGICVDAPPAPGSR